MGNSFLKLNENKTEVIIFGSPTTSAVINTVLGPLPPYQKPVVTNLWVFFDSDLKFDRQLNYVVSASFYQLRTIAEVQNFLSPKDGGKVVHAFISSRLVYCLQVLARHH